MTRQVWQYWRGGLAENVCNSLIQRAENKYPLQEAETFGGHASDVRTSKIRFCTGDADIENLLFNFVNQAAQIFGVSVNKKADIQYTEYHASEGGHYNWHHDINWNRDDGYDRKLSITVQLSHDNDYTGGDFTFNEVENPNASEVRQRGTVLIFPSYLQHKVSPVISGVRRSMVAWFEGPPWR